MHHEQKSTKIAEKENARICGECFEILGIEVEHKSPPFDKTDDQFVELEVKFNQQYLIKDWRTFPTIKNCTDLWKIADYIVRFAFSVVSSLEGYNDLLLEDHFPLLSQNWHHLIQWYAVYSSSQNAIFYNIRIKKCFDNLFSIFNFFIFFYKNPPR